MLEVISTIGPASNNENTIKKLASISSSFRVNASHMTPVELDELLMKLKRIIDIPVIIDLKGAKIRIGEYPQTKVLPENIVIKNISKSDDINIIPLENKNFFNSIKVKDKLYLNDANIVLYVVGIKNNQIKCRVLKNGELSSNKGINIKNNLIKYEKITDIDKSMILLANRFNFTSFAFSFVLNGAEYDILKKYTDKKIIAKIERPEAIKNLKNIDKNFDGIWFCRGDLGAEAGLENLGKLQYEFSKEIKKLSKDTYLAGQVLHHLTYFDTPTRTEITALYQIKQEGYKGFVLSDETAVGKHIDSVIDFLNKVNN